MGQVERYGVFALCVVIFLILGIAIWGGGTPAPALGAAGAGKEVVAAPKAGGKDSNSPLVSETEQKELLDATRKNGKPVATFANGNVEVVPDPAVRPEPAAGGRTYKVKSGDTLSRIAAHELGDKRKVDAILAANPGLDARKLQPNQEIKLPGTTARSEAKADSKTDTRTPARTETPRTETLGVRKDETGKDAGKAKPTTQVAKGKDVRQPATKAHAQPNTQPADKAAWPKHYKVASGDKLATIARRFYGDDKKFTVLAKANGIKDASQVREGMMLTIPAVN